MFSITVLLIKIYLLIKYVTDKNCSSFQTIFNTTIKKQKKVFHSNIAK